MAISRIVGELEERVTVREIGGFKLIKLNKIKSRKGRLWRSEVLGSPIAYLIYAYMIYHCHNVTSSYDHCQHGHYHQFFNI